jgi:hypothetical protein
MSIHVRVEEISVETELFGDFITEECTSVQANLNNSIDSVIEEIEPIFETITELRSFLKSNFEPLIHNFDDFKSTEG